MITTLKIPVFCDFRGNYCISTSSTVTFGIYSIKLHVRLVMMIEVCKRYIAIAIIERQLGATLGKYPPDAWLACHYHGQQETCII